MVVCLIVIAILVVSLLMGIPMAIGLAIAGLITLVTQFPGMPLDMAMQQMYTGLNSFSLLAVPMFMLGAEIMCSGQCADRLLKFIRSLLGHLPGGIAITSIGTCTLFGAVSGSTQATFVAVGRPMMKELRRLPQRRYADERRHHRPADPAQYQHDYLLCGGQLLRG